MPHRKRATIRRFLGIDPGKTGGLVSFRSGSIRIGATTQVLPMPETERDIWDWFASMGASTVAYIEWIHPAIQGIHKSNMSKLYGNYCSLRMALTAAKIPFEDVKPVTWQRGLGISPRKRVGKKAETDYQWKNRLRDKAQQLFPKLPIWSEPRSKGRQLAISDALLIAEYCRRTWRVR